MATEVFNRRPVNTAGVYHSDNAGLIFPDAGGRGSATSLSAAGVQRFSLQYSQNVARFFDMQGPGSGGAVNVYYIIGRAAGAAGANHLVGPVASVRTWYERFGNGCNACFNEIAITMNAGNCCTPGGGDVNIDYQISNVLMNAMSLGMTAEQMVIMHDTSLMFTGAVYF